MPRVNAQILEIQPSGFLNYRTFNLTITTSVDSECKYSYIDQTFNQMPNQISTSGTTHEIQITESTDGEYIYYVGCKSQGFSYLSQTIIIDTISPTITNYEPQNNITTKFFNLTIQTNEQANCSYSKTSDNYISMLNVQDTISTIQLEWDFINTIDYNIICEDLAKNTIQDTITVFATDYPVFTSELIFDDNIINPENEIDLSPNSTTKVWCNTTVSHINDSIQSIVSTLKYQEKEYLNYSCILIDNNIECSHNLFHYDLSGNWECTVIAIDTYNQSREITSQSFVTELLAINIQTKQINFGLLKLGETSLEQEIIIKNHGNIILDFQIDAWVDNLDLNSQNAFSCNQGSIPTSNLGYSLISNSQPTNLVENGVITENNFNLEPNQENSLFLSVQIPSTQVSGFCTGKIGIFGIKS